MNNTLLVIDSYLSSDERINVCSKLIDQIKNVFPEYKILLLNKHSNSGKLECKVDYYFYYGNSFLVGEPPKYLLENSLYERPYVYTIVGGGTCENWLPLVGITDHVAGIYNSFILSSRIAKILNFSHVYKFEYDTYFDLDELLDIKNDIEKELDFLFYGKRHEGVWSKDNQYLIDVHICGYNNKIFDEYDLINDDIEYWKLCESINYYGKWIEYIIPMLIEKQNINKYNGIMYERPVWQKYTKTKFDVINGGMWMEKWNNIPKVCSVNYEEGMSANSTSNFVLFYYNDKEDPLSVNAILINSSGIEVYNKNIILYKSNYYYEELKLDDTYTIYKKNTINNITTNFVETIDIEFLKNTNTRFVYNQK